MAESLYDHLEDAPATVESDDLQARNAGRRVVTDVAGNITGWALYIVTTLPETELKWQLWDNNTDTKLAEVDVLALAPSTNGWATGTSADFEPDGLPIPFDDTDDFTVSGYTIGTPGDWGYTAGTGAIDSGNLHSSTARYRGGGNNNQRPTVNDPASFYADLFFEADGGGPVEVALTPATLTLAAQALTATPGMVTVNLTPATVSFAAQAVTPAPGMVTVNLAPAQLTLAPQSLAATPGMVTVNLTPAALALAAQPLPAAPNAVTVNLTPAQLALTARALTATPGMVTVALTPAALQLIAVAFVFIGTPGRLTASLMVWWSRSATGPGLLRSASLR